MAASDATIPSRTSKRRLYGRDHEIARLQELLERCIGRTAHSSNVGTRQLVLLGGPRGVGKRSLVYTLEPSVKEHHGVIGSVSFAPKASEAYPPRVPLCSPLFPAVQAVVDSMAEDQWNELFATDSSLNLQRYFPVPSDWNICTEFLASMRRRNPTSTATASSKGNEHPGRHEETRLCSLPDFQKQETVLSIPLASSLERGEPVSYGSILCRLMGALSTLQPVVLLLEENQHADAESLDAIVSLLDSNSDCNADTKGLLVILSYQNDDVDVASAWSTFLSRRLSVQESNECAFDTVTIDLVNLNRANVQWWVTEHVRQVRDTAETSLLLSDCIYNRTLGNPQLTQYLLVLMLQSGDHAGCRRIIESLPMPLDRASLFWWTVECQENLVQRVIEIMVVLQEYGDHGSLSTLETLLQQPCREALSIAKEYGLLTRGTLHDVYACMADEKRTRVHVWIGRRLWKISNRNGNAETIDDASLYGMAWHLWNGLALVTDAHERNMIAVMHWQAGRRAMQSANFSSAATFFELALSVWNGDDSVWLPTDDRYELMLALYNGAAEAYYCTGDFVAMNRMLDTILANAARFTDKLQAYTTLVFAKGSRHQLKEAVELVHFVLDELNERVPRHPCQWRVLLEFVKTRRLLRGKSERFFSSLPSATDTDMIAVMTLLNFAFTYSYVRNPERGALALFRLIRLIIDYGVTPLAPAAFSAYGMLLSLFFQRFAEGYRYGQIALSLLDQVHSKAWRARVHLMVYGPISTWIRPFRENLEPLLLSHRAALKSGDNEGSITCATIYFKVAFYVGSELGVVENEASSFCRLMETLGQTAGLAFLLPLWNMFSDLAGKSCLELNLTGNLNDATSALHVAEEEGNKLFVTFFFLYRAITCYLVGDYNSALEAVQKARASSNGTDSSLDFYEGLTSLTLARDSKGLARYQHMRNGRQMLRRMKRYSALCPANFRNKRALLQAELESLRGRRSIGTALSLYDESIAAAKTEGFAHEEGIAYERLAQYHRHLGHLQAGEPFFVLARDAYIRWGAQKLVWRMDDLIQKDANACKAAGC